MDTDDDDWFLEPPLWEQIGLKGPPPPADWWGDIFPRWEAHRRACLAAGSELPAGWSKWQDILALHHAYGRDRTYDRGGREAWHLTCDGAPPDAFRGNTALRLLLAGRLGTPMPCDGHVIGTRAFKDCVNLEYIPYLHPGVLRIDEEAFAGCIALRECGFPEWLTHIGRRAFFGCRSLWRMVLPDGLETIGEEAFAGCAGLLGVTFQENLPDCLQTIGARAFAGCANLRSIELPTTLATLGEKAFAGCRALRHVTLPRTVEAAIPAAFPDSPEARFGFR